MVTYMEYHPNNRIQLCGVPVDTNPVPVDPRKSVFNIKLALGKSFIDNKNCRTAIDATKVGVIFSSNDMSCLVSNTNSLDKKDIFTIYKNGVTLYIKKNKKESNSFTLVKIICEVKINPGISKSVQTPINIITELNSNRNGNSKLMETKIVEVLLN